MAEQHSVSSQSLNQQDLNAYFNNLSTGICAVDANFNLLVWNPTYEAMFHYPAGMLRRGLPVLDIIRYDAEHGFLGEGDTDEFINQSMSLLSSGKHYQAIRHYDKTRSIEIKGSPLPNGGYLTIYNDISVQQQLKAANSRLEKQVLEHGQALASVNAELQQEIQVRIALEKKFRQAKSDAEEAYKSKVKFLSLAGHDIMQPLNAASLYVSALNNPQGFKPATVQRLSQAIKNTESIICSVLDVSKLDGGKLEAKVETFPVDSVLSNLVDEAKVQCSNDIVIRYCPSSIWVSSDKHYLRRIIQNLISNAVKYTHTGKVLVGCRQHYSPIAASSGDTQRALGALEICVLDNGPGIAAQEQEMVFEDFYRGERMQQRDDIPGIGLGLSIVARFSKLLNHPVRCESSLGRGSCFSVTVPMAERAEAAVLASNVEAPNEFNGLKLLYVDDDALNLMAISALLESWQCEVATIASADAAHAYAEENERPDILMMDFQLGYKKVTGLRLAQELITIWQSKFTDVMAMPVCIVSAETEASIVEEIAQLGYHLLRKPVRPARLRAFLTQFAR